MAAQSADQDLDALFARVDLLERAEGLAETQGLDVRAAIAKAEARAGAAGVQTAASP